MSDPLVRSDNVPLDQIGHEGNPVLFDLPVVGTLDSPEPCEGCGDEGGPVLIPPTGSGGGGGGGGDNPNLPLNVSGGGGNCFQGNCATFAITGGTPPYQASTSVGVITMNGAGTGGTICEGTNSGATESPGTAAYGKVVSYCCTFPSTSCEEWDCSGASIRGCGPTNCNTLTGLAGCAGAGCSSCGACSSCLVGCVSDPGCSCFSVDACGSAGCCGVSGCCGASGCECNATYGTFFDERAANGLSGACQPCAIQFQNGAILTVTDSLGNTAITSIDWGDQQ